MPQHTTHTRDAALRELNRLNRWFIAGSVVLTGVLADVAANAFPGKSRSAIAKTTSPTSPSKAGPSRTSTGVLRPPAQAPQSSTGESAPSQPAAPAQESAPAKESGTPSQESTPTPSQESAPSKEAAPSQEAPAGREAAPAQQSPPAQESTPEQRSAPPVVSGGS